MKKMKVLNYKIDKYKNKFNLLSVLQTEDKLTEILKNRSMER